MNEKMLAETIISRMQNAKDNKRNTAHVLFSTLENDFDKNLSDMKQFMNDIGLDYNQSSIPGAAMVSLEVSVDKLDILKNETF